MQLIAYGNDPRGQRATSISIGESDLDDNDDNGMGANGAGGGVVAPPKVGLPLDSNVDDEDEDELFNNPVSGSSAGGNISAGGDAPAVVKAPVTAGGPMNANNAIGMIDDIGNAIGSDIVTAGPNGSNPNGPKPPQFD